MTLLTELMVTEKSQANKEVKQQYRKMVKHLETEANTIKSMINRYSEDSELGKIMMLAGKGAKRKAIVSHLNGLVTELNKG